MEEDAGGSAPPPEEGYLLVRVHVPELNVQKCLQFPRDQLVWDVKQQCLAALPKVFSPLASHCLVFLEHWQVCASLQYHTPLTCQCALTFKTYEAC